LTDDQDPEFVIKYAKIDGVLSVIFDRLRYPLIVNEKSRIVATKNQNGQRKILPTTSGPVRVFFFCKEDLGFFTIFLQ